MRRRMIYALIVCLLWSSIAQSAIWANELPTQADTEGILDAFQQLMDEETKRLEQPEPPEPSNLEGEFAQLAVDRPVLDDLPALTNQRSIAFTGTAIPSSRVSLYYMLGSTGAENYAGEGTASESGSFEVQVAIESEGVYTFYARSVLDDQTSENSEPAVIEFDWTPPSYPLDIYAEVTHSTITIRWSTPIVYDPNAGHHIPDRTVNHYEIRKPDGDIVIIDKDEPIYEDAGLPPESVFRYVLYAVDAAGNRSMEQAITAVTRHQYLTVIDESYSSLYNTVISGDGNVIAYRSSSSDNPGIFTYNRQSGEKVKIASGRYVNWDKGIAISDNGQYVLYQESELSSEGRQYSLHLYNSEDESTLEILTSSSPFESIGLGGNGSSVVFSSDDDDIVESTPDKSDVFLINLSDRSNMVISCLSYFPYSGNEPGNSREPYITNSGAFVVFESDSKTLIGGNIPLYDNFSRIHLYDVHGQTRYVIRIMDGEQELIGHKPTVTEDGNFVAYTAIRGAENSVQEKLTGFYNRSGNIWTVLHRLPGNTDIIFDKPYIYYYPHGFPMNTNIYVVQEYNNYSPSAEEAPFLSQQGAMHYAYGGVPSRVEMRNLISDNGNNAREARANREGTAVVFRDNSSAVPGNAVYYVCLQFCAELLPIESAAWSSPAASKVGGELKRGSEISLQATGAAGQQLEAFIAYTRLNEVNPDVVEDAVMTIPMSESPQGTYRTSFVLPERTVEITSITVRLTNRSYERLANDAPILAAGALRVDIDAGQPGMLDRTEIVIARPGISPVTIPVSTTNSSYEVELASGQNYSVTLRKLDGTVLAQQNDVQVANGRLTALTLAPFAIYSFYHLGSLLYNQYVERGQLIPLQLVADEGASVEVTVTYTTAVGTEELQVAMTPGSVPTRYEGSFEVPQAAVGIASIAATASRGDLSATREALRQPLIAAGSLEIEIGNDVNINGYQLTVGSDSLGVTRNISLKDYDPTNRTLEVERLAPAPDYRFTLADRSGRDWLENRPAPVAIEPGQQQTVTLHPTPPSSVVVQVKMEDTNVAYATELVISDGTTTYTATSYDGMAVFERVGSMLGNRVTITAVRVPSFYQPGEVVIEELLPGLSNVELVIKRKDRATVEGAVTDRNGNPIHGATVRVTMNQYTAEAVTAEDGTYSLESPAGSATLSASFRNLATPANAGRVMLRVGMNSVPLVVQQHTNAIIDISLYTKFAGGNWVGPHEFDWRTAVHYRVSADRPILMNASPFTVKASEGETVTVCLNGVESGLPSACGTAVIGEDMKGSVEIRLEQFSGQVAAEMFPFQGNGFKQLYAVDSNGRRTIISQTVLEPGAFVHALPAAGTYEFWFYVNSKLAAKRQFNVIEDDIVQLGMITPNPISLFSGYAGNEVTSNRSIVTAGTQVQIRAAYRNGSVAGAIAAKLWLDIPPTASYVPGSAVWNGEPVNPVSEGGKLYIPIGDVAPGNAGTVYYTLQFEQSDTAGTILIAPGLTHERTGHTVEEWLGNVQLRRLGVTLAAPAFATQRAIPVSGIAPPGSTVRVYDRSSLLGEALAAPTGAWQLTVEAGGEAPIYTYLLSATAEKDDAEWSSDTIVVRIDKNYPEPVEFSMQQTDGRKITIDPRGAGKFPYVHAVGMPYHFSVTFKHPERVKNVRFVIGSASIAAAKRLDGTFTANTMVSNVGAIGVDYDIVESAESLGTYIESEEERMSALPPQFQNAEEVEINISPKTDGGNKQSASYKAIIPTAGGGDVDYRLNVSFERKLYTPSQSDLDRAAELGIPLYGTQMSYAFQNGRLHIEMSGYIPEGVFDQYAKGKSVSLAAAELAAGKVVGAIAARISVNVGAKAGDATWIGITSAFTLYDGRGGMGDILNNMGDLLDEVALNCSPEAYQKYAHELDRLNTKLIINEVIKGGIALGGVIMGPATFGVGSVALFIVSAAYGKLLDAEAEGQFQRLKDKVAADSNCKTEKKPRKPKRDLADPVWIHDPSGYVYEVEHSNRIEDVKATALNWNAEAGRWEVWDADWFGQQNPLYTNSEGRYGWDVPEGRWKVLYEKEGYLPRESWEMTVLPPHFDVNVGLVSFLPSHVVKVSAAPGGEYVDILFNRHVREQSIHGLSVWLVASSERQPMIGQLSLVDAVAHEGRNVSRVVRFTPQEPLAAGEEYELNVDESVQSYNGIAMSESYRGNVTVSAVDETPPHPVTELTAEADASSLIVNWKEVYDPDLDRLELRVAKADRSGEMKVYEIAKGVRWAMAEGLEPGAAYEVEVHALDAAGNRAVTRADAATGSGQTAGPDVVPPFAPAEVAATAVAGGIRVAWSDPDDAELDHVAVAWKRVGQPESSDMVASVGVGVGEKIIGSLTGGASYEISVYAVNRNGLVSDRIVLSATAGHTAGGGTGGGGGNPGQGGGQPDNGGGQEQPDGNSDMLHLEPGGGTYTLLNGEVKLILPEGALRTEARMAAERLPVPTANGALKPVSRAYKLTLELIRSLDKTAVIALPYDAAKAKGADKRKLGLYRLDDSGVWSYVGGIADAETATVSASFLTSGTYAVMLNEVTFADMARHWAKEAVEVLAAKGLVSGASPERFEPEREVTRAEFAKLAVMLVRSLRDEASIAEANAAARGITLPIIFSDVAEGAWYADDVREAAALGLMRGAYDKFRPNDAVTREEMMTVIARALGFDPASKLNAEVILRDYRDSGEMSDWARNPAAYLIGAGLIEGASGSLHPKGYAKRAEAATVLLRALEQQKE